MKDEPSQPQAVNPTQLAQAQSAANVDTARVTGRINRMDVYNPYSATTYSDLGNDRYRQETVLNPQDQAALDQRRAITSQLGGLGEQQIGRISDNLSTPFSYAGMPAYQAGVDTSGLPSLTQDFSADRKRVEDAMYGQATSRLDPMWQERERAMESRLANQGITMGSEAYQGAMSDMDTARTDAYQTALNSAIAAGGQEQSRLYGLTSGQRAQLYGEGQNAMTAQNAARQNAINEATFLRGLPLQELNSLMGNTSQIQAPQAPNPGQVQVAPTDVMGAYGMQQAGQQNAYNTAQQSNNAALGGLFSLGGSGLMAYGLGGGFK
jgi:hypothetical protein